MTGAISSNLTPYLPASYTDSKGDLTVSDAQATSVATDIETRADSLPPAEKMLFLAMVADDSAALAPTGGAPPANLDATLARLENASQALGAFLSGAVNATALTRVIIELASSEEKDALNNRLAAIQQATAELHAQAGDERQAATDMRTGAITALVLGEFSAAMSIASGAVGIAGSAKALKGLSDELGDGEGLPTPKQLLSDPDDTPVPAPKISPEKLEHIKAGLQHSQGIAGVLSGVGQVFKSAGDFGNEWMQAQAKDDEASGSDAAADAQQAQAQASLAQTVQQSLTDLITSLIQTMNELMSTTSDMMHSITKG